MGAVLRKFKEIQLYYNAQEASFAECGVWKGHSAYILSTLLKESKQEKESYIFDSFEGGLSDKVDEDKNQRYNLSQKQINEEKLSFSSTEGQVKSTLSTFYAIRFFKGWIPDRFPEVATKEFSFVHIDVDL